VRREDAGPVGEDVAQAVCERLWKELKAGRHRDGKHPFRVIVHSVIGWVCKGWYEPGWQESELFDFDGAGPDEAADVVIEVTLEQFVATLPPGDGEIAALYYVDGLEPGEIADRVGKKPNAVYQAISRNKQRLQEWLEA
jgi:RNA polymerase sigma factor (sigma-70 family)